MKLTPVERRLALAKSQGTIGNLNYQACPRVPEGKPNFYQVVMKEEENLLGLKKNALN
jgi:hypothetical protein